MSKKKKIIIGVVSAVVLIGVVLGITLPLVLKKKNPDPVPPEPPIPPIPPTPDKE